MKHYKLLGCLVVVMLMLTGCSPVRTIYRTEYEIKEVLVPVPVKIPEVTCSFVGKDADEVMNNMLNCISKQKKVLNILRDKYLEAQKLKEEEEEEYYEEEEE